MLMFHFSYFLRFIYFERERERECKHEQGRGREREEEKESQAGSMLSTEPDTKLNLMTDHEPK